MLGFRVLGPLEAADEHGELPLGGPKRRALLAFLLFNTNEVISTDRLAEELWDGRPPANTAASIHNHVSRLRKAIGADVLVTHRWGYVLRVDRSQIDAARFEEAVAAAEALPAAERAARLTEALALWRGPPLADLAFEPALAPYIGRLEEIRLAALEQRIDADLELGRDTELIPELETLIAANPLREHFRWQLILALYRGGRQAEALEVYRETRRMLADELGLEPGPELRALERAVLQQDPSLTRTTATVPVEGVPPHTERARRRARAAVFAVFAAGALAAGGYAVSGKLGGRAPAAAAETHPAATQAPRTRRPSSRARQTVGDRTAQRRVKHRTRLVAAKHQLAAAVRRRHQVVRHTPAPTTQQTTAPAPRAAPPPRPPPTTTAPTTTTTTAPTTTVEPPPPPPASPVLGDRRGWWAGGGDQSQVTVDQTPGSVSFTVPATAPDGFNSSVTTRCRLAGDFDVQVGFRLDQWSGGDGIWVSLLAADLGGVNVYRTDAFGETYGAYFPPNGTPPVSASGSSGQLRLIRAGSEFTGEYDDGSGWRTLLQGPGSAAPTAVQLGVFNLSNVAPFAGYPAEITFTSLAVTGAFAC